LLSNVAGEKKFHTTVFMGDSLTHKPKPGGRMHRLCKVERRLVPQSEISRNVSSELREGVRKMPAAAWEAEVKMQLQRFEWEVECLRKLNDVEKEGGGGQAVKGVRFVAGVQGARRLKHVFPATTFDNNHLKGLWCANQRSK
jgi:hypothetical protein